MKWSSLLLLLALLGGCEHPEPPVLTALPATHISPGNIAAPRVSGPIGSTNSIGTPEVSIGSVRTVNLPTVDQATGVGDISLDFVDTDIREVVAQVLGNILRVNYTIDPAVRGTATLRTVNPISRSRVLPVLQSMLAQNGATVIESSGIYRVVPAASAVTGAGIAGGVALGGAAIVPLEYASAEDLAKVMQPYAGTTGRVVADAGRNTLIISGDPATREALLNLVHAFDINVLAGQSYALFPVTSGNAKDFATAMTEAMRSTQGAPLAGLVRVVPMDRINSILVVSSQPRYIDDARRVYGLVERSRRQTVRSWNVYYLQNSRSNDIAYVLQQAFTPNHVTAVPSARAAGTAGLNRNSTGSGGSGGSGFNQGSSGSSGTSGIGGGLSSSSSSTSLGGSSGQSASGTGQQDASQNPANPLLGGLEPSGSGSGSGSSSQDNNPNAIRIIPNGENNAVLIYATPQERDTIEAMLRKIDILPLQVRIDAVIAEVTLNDTLKYGTQFFFKAGGVNGALNFNTAATSAGDFLSGFPGFVLSGNNGGNAALSALQDVTTVKVLSSPQLMVLDNEEARLQVGNLVPYLTSSSQSTVANSSVINSIDYRETGVIMQVTPRVNSGGLVTLDIAQEVSDVDTAATSSSTIQSPTFEDRNVRSRVVVQDGQTVGLAGLIRDTTSTDNSGIPWLKDVPLLGALAGTQNNTRTRTELLVLITPHVIHDQRDARALTEDLRDQLINAATIPDDLQRKPLSGSSDPQHRLRRDIGLDRTGPP